MRVFGTPEKPNPPTKTVVSDFMSLMASCAEETILLMAGRDALAEKNRKPVAGPRRRAENRRERCIVRVVLVNRNVTRKRSRTNKLQTVQDSLRWRTRLLQAWAIFKSVMRAQSTTIPGSALRFSAKLNAQGQRVRNVVYSRVDAPHTSTMGMHHSN